MRFSDTYVASARDSRLAALAFAPTPALLWSPEKMRIVWANAAGADIMGVELPARLTERTFGEKDPATHEIQRLLPTLPLSGAAQLSRLRGLLPGPGRLFTCACARYRASDGSTQILITATDPPKPALSLPERVRRPLADASDLAAFGLDGALLYAGEDFGRYIGAQSTLATLGGDPLLQNAIAIGIARAAFAGGVMSVERLGAGDAVILLATLEASRAAQEEEPNTPADIPPSPAPVTPDEPRTPLARTIADIQERAAVAATAAPTTVERQHAESSATQGGSANAPSLWDEIDDRYIARRHPLRFVWRIDPEGRLAIESDDFIAVTGAPTRAVLGIPWREAVAALGIDPEARLERAIAARDTFSGTLIYWPIEDGAERLPVSLSGLPVLGADRHFAGYRGFGVCRNVARIRDALHLRRTAAAHTASELGPGQPLVPGDAPPPAAPQTAGLASDAAQASTPPAAPQPPRPPRKTFTVVPPVENVVPLRPGPSPERRVSLSTVERDAFQEIARTLGAAEVVREPLPDVSEPVAADAGEQTQTKSPNAVPQESAPDDMLLRAALDRLPLAVLVFKGDTLLHANRALLEWTGHETLQELTGAGGLGALFGEPIERGDADGSSRAMSLLDTRGQATPVDARLSALSLGETCALMLVLSKVAPDLRAREAERAAQRADDRARELKSILDTATDGVIVVDDAGRIASVNRSAEALFGFEARELLQRSFVELFAPESQRNAADYLEGLTRSGVASLLNDGREVIGRVRQGGLIPLFMTMGRIADAPAKFCAVFRDITQWKRAEEELTNAKRHAEKASSAKSDFLAKISHEVRTPLNAIIGFSEVMMEERFGPIGNERYRGYAKDIHTSGEHIISLLNDLLDLSKIEAGKLELNFAKVDLNDVMHQCVAIMQPQANRERIIIRTALSTSLPPVVADTRSIRQIVLNLLSNSIKFTGAGGQVIVSTALTENGEAVLRVRDTGTGMSEKDIETALEPFRQLPSAARAGAAGTGLGLPLTKALAEANRASFHISSKLHGGTLVEVVFPANRVLAE